MNNNHYNVIVIGGGPSGMMAAGRAAECGAHVLLLEKNDRLGKKLSITGGRRCNITNAEYDNALFLQNFRKAETVLIPALEQFSVKDTFTFFEGRGLPLKVEDRKRAFPQSENAQDVCNLLSAYVAESGKVDVRLGTEVTDFILADGTLNGVHTRNGSFFADKVILATGGLAAPETGSTGEGWSMLSTIGHTVKDPDPSLVPLKSPARWVHKLSGTAVNDAMLRFVLDGNVEHEVEGRILFTHFGLSGPTVINAAYIAKELVKKGSLVASIDLFPWRSIKQLDNQLRSMFTQQPKKLVKGVMRELLQKKLADSIMDNMDPSIAELKVSSVSKAQRQMLVARLKNLEVPISGTMGFDWAIIADGGVITDEVNFHTMASTLFPNLYLIGDTININRPSGGFSLQLCWTMGYIAGTHASN